jgi:SAM-dependent methyltransferase
VRQVATGALPQPGGSFDELALHFDRFAELVGGPLTHYLEGVFPEQGERAVDLGCGTGQHAALLAHRYRQVLAVDVSAPMLELARARRDLPNITYQQRDLRDVQVATDGRFDLVFSAYVLHHVEDLDVTLRGIRGLVPPAGRVVLVDNVAPQSRVPRRWFLGEAVRLLAGDLLGRRRPLAEAVELFRLNTHPAWLDHLTSDRFLNPAQFQHHYGAVFPGARTTALYRARALCWDAPPTGGPAGKRT